jgi:YD repeat-containing protein
VSYFSNGLNSVKGSVAFAYNNDQQVTTETVLLGQGAADSVNLKYDKDGLLTSAGDIKLRYSIDNNLLISDTVGNIITNYTYDGFGALASKEVKSGAAILYRIDFVRDSLSRIIEKTENTQGNIAKYDYSYDIVGRLLKVWKNDTLKAEYQYDQNGNRPAKMTPTDTASGVYDAQDRLLFCSSTHRLNDSTTQLLLSQHLDIITLPTVI